MTRAAIPWRNLSEEAVDEAERAGAPVLLLVGARWCEASDELERAVCDHPGLRALLLRRAIPMKADMDTFPEAARWAGMDAPPFLVVVPFGGGGRLFDGARIGQAAEAIRGLLKVGASGTGPVRPGPPSIRIPWVTPSTEPLAAAPQTLESILARLLEAYDPSSGTFGGARSLEPLRFLVKAGFSTNDASLLRRAVGGLHALAHSSAYDDVEGGFFCRAGDGGRRSAKLLRDNADILVLALRLAGLEGADFAPPLARGILHYVQSHLALPSGAIANGQRGDASYYALNGEERRRVPPPPVDSRVFLSTSAAAVKALCKAHQRLGERAYLDLALAVHEFVARNLALPGGRFARGWDGGAFESADLDGLTEWGYAQLALFHATLDEGHLEVLKGIVRGDLPALRNPCGLGYLDVVPEGPTARLFGGPAVDAALGARLAGLLMLTSTHLQDEAMASEGEGLLAASLGLLGGNPSPHALAHAGSALLSYLYPVPVYTAVTDGTEPQRRRVLGHIASLGAAYALVMHRGPSPSERMQPLPKLFVQCGAQKREIVPA